MPLRTVDIPSTRGPPPWRTLLHAHRFEHSTPPPLRCLRFLTTLSDTSSTILHISLLLLTLGLAVLSIHGLKTLTHLCIATSSFLPCRLPYILCFLVSFALSCFIFACSYTRLLAYLHYTVPPRHEKQWVGICRDIVGGLGCAVLFFGAVAWIVVVCEALGLCKEGDQGCRPIMAFVWAGLAAGVLAAWEVAVVAEAWRAWRVVVEAQAGRARKEDADADAAGV